MPVTYLPAGRLPEAVPTAMMRESAFAATPVKLMLES